MRFTLIVLFSLVFSELTSGTDYYTDSYDYVDVNAIISSDRLFNQYLDCILDKGPCTADGRSLKRILPEAIATSCEKCNPRQKQMARRVIFHIKDQRPQTWITLLEKFDPNKEYIENLEQFLAQID